MKEKTLTVLCRIYRILLSISIIAAGLCLIYGCLSIYYAGQGYSHEAVADAFGKINVPVYICQGLVVLSVFVPALSVKHKAEISYKTRLEVLLSKKDINGCEDIIKKERNRRRIISIFKWALTAIACVAFLVYALNPNHFDSKDINGSVIKAMWVMLPCLGVSLMASVIAEVLFSKSAKRECELLAKLPTLKSASSQEEKCDKKILIIRCAVLILGAGLLIYGLATGGFYDVLTKAVNICTECIGLG